MHGNSRQSLSGALRVFDPSCGSGPAADGSKEMSLLPKEHPACPAGRGKEEKGY